jgi:hypothetical protein
MLRRATLRTKEAFLAGAGAEALLVTAVLRALRLPARPRDFSAALSAKLVSA